MNAAPFDHALRAWGYAPGGYSVTCSDCGQRADGLDKRARRCRPCAEVAMRGEPLVMKRVDLEDTGAVAGMMVIAAIGTITDFRVGEVVVDTLDRRWRLRHVQPRPEDTPHPTRNAVLVGVAA